MVALSYNRLSKHCSQARPVSMVPTLIVPRFTLALNVGLAPPCVGSKNAQAHVTPPSGPVTVIPRKPIGDEEFSNDRSFKPNNVSNPRAVRFRKVNPKLATNAD